ncbi:MAG: hypothetical protein ABJB03_09825 [Rhodoglobus sp.]
MAVSVKAIVQTRGALVAAIVALGVGVVLVAQQYLQNLISSISALPYMDPPTLYLPSPVAVVVPLLPLVIGVFLSLWVLAPIAAELRIGHVVTRSILAVGIGCTLVFVALAIVALVGSVSFTGAIFGSSFPTPAVSGGSIASGLGSALAGALIEFVEAAPVGVLGGVLAWIWLTRHPAKHPVSGMLDEV